MDIGQDDMGLGNFSVELIGGFRAALLFRVGDLIGVYFQLGEISHGSEELDE